MLSAECVSRIPHYQNWEYAVLVCDTPYQLEPTGQIYRNRADGENGFDEIKNQWAGVATARTTSSAAR